MTSPRIREANTAAKADSKEAMMLATLVSGTGALLRLCGIDTDADMNPCDIAAKLCCLLAAPPTPGLTSLSCVGGVYCAVRHQLRSISLSAPAAVLVLDGCKVLWRGGERMEIRAGNMFLLPARMELDIENVPGTDSGIYQALCLSFSSDVLDAVCSARAGGAPPISLDSLRVGVDTPLLQAVGHLLDMALAANTGERVLRLCMEEILELAGQRTACLPLIWEMSSTWSSRCARIIALDPGRNWAAADVATRLCVSERGLRRNLRVEGAGLRRILQDVRLNAGLSLLQAGGCSVSEASFRCGYASASRFAILFRERFGVSPGDVPLFNAVS